MAATFRLVNVFPNGQHALPVTFDELGFAPSYDVEVDPEFPGDGEWPDPLFTFSADGALTDTFRSAWGPPFIIMVRPSDGPAWIGMFAAGGFRGLLSGAFACPDPMGLVVATEGRVYLVNVAAPQGGATIVRSGVRQIARVVGLALVLLVRDLDIVALGSQGVEWGTPRLVVDGLRVDDASAARIVCSGDNLGGSATIELDPITGEQVAGTRLDSFWPPDALA